MKLKDLMPEKVLNMDSIVWLQTASRAGGLNHLQFQEFLKSVDANYGDIICLSEKKNAVWTKCRKDFIICGVLSSYLWLAPKPKSVPELDENRLTDFSFSMDSTTHSVSWKSIFKVKKNLSVQPLKSR